MERTGQLDRGWVEDQPQRESRELRGRNFKALVFFARCGWCFRLRERFDATRRTQPRSFSVLCVSAVK
jgi:hypothetical protein